MSNEIATYTTVVPTQELVNTVNADTVDGKLILFDAVQNAQSLNEHMEETLIISDCIMRAGKRKTRSANGANEPCVDVYLIDVNGVGYFSQSEGVKRAAETLASLFPDFGKSLPEKGLKLKCVEREMKNGNTLKTLVTVK